ISAILAGEKRIEFRRRAPSRKISGCYLAPKGTGRVVAWAPVSEIITLPVAEMWRRFRSCSGCTPEPFSDSFAGRDVAVGLKLGEIRRLEPFPLEATWGIRPPQQFAYVAH